MVLDLLVAGLSVYASVVGFVCVCECGVCGGLCGTPCRRGVLWTDLEPLVAVGYASLMSTRGQEVSDGQAACAWAWIWLSALLLGRLWCRLFVL